ncbi:MAG: hypothetical protein ABJF11_04230 [Reichenbachiella sp.]|uniref:hypothetical protein n=1 Tax=Reichenbachiella sp. TaxID=2184521 RepID=UPI0032648CA2
MKEELSHTESLKIINEMISEAKNSFDKNGSFYFLLWGWVIMIANLSHYILDKYTSYEYPFVVWLITIPAIVATIWYSIKLKSKAQSQSHLTRLYGEVWIGVGISIILSLIFMSKINFNHTAIIMMSAGMGTYLSGRMLKFKPLVFGAIALWLSSLICFTLPMTEQHLVASIGILAGYLIPGYLLKSMEK